MILFVWIWIGAGPASAVTSVSPESAFVSRLVRARRPADVERVRGQFDHLRISRLSCDLQVARGIAPLQCYEVLATERAWRMISPAQFRRRRRRLDAACAAAAMNLRVPTAVVALGHVSADCVARVGEARLNLDYQREDRPWSGD